MVTFIFDGYDIPSIEEQERIKKGMIEKLGTLYDEADKAGVVFTFHCPLDGTKETEVTYSYPPTLALDFTDRWNLYIQEQQNKSQ